jgi:hypothetical protein
MDGCCTLDPLETIRLIALNYFKKEEHLWTDDDKKRFVAYLKGRDNDLYERLKQPYQTIYTTAMHEAKALNIHDADQVQTFFKKWLPEVPRDFSKSGAKETHEALRQQFLNNYVAHYWNESKEQWALSSTATNDLDTLLNSNAQQYDHVITMSGSNRQLREAECLNTHKSHIPSFDTLPDIMASVMPKNAKHTHNSILLNDVLRNWPVGTTASNPSSMPTLDPNVQISIDTIIPFHEQEKVLLLYFQMAYVAKQYPGATIDFTFNDDKMPLLEGLKKFFEKHPDWVPSNVNLMLNHMDGLKLLKQYATPMGERSSNTTQDITPDGGRLKARIDDWLRHPPKNLPTTTDEIIQNAMHTLGSYPKDRNTGHVEQYLSSLSHYLSEKENSAALASVLNGFEASQRTEACDAILKTCLTTCSFRHEDFIQYAQYYAYRKATSQPNSIVYNITPSRDEKQIYIEWLKKNITHNNTLKNLTSMLPMLCVSQDWDGCAACKPLHTIHMINQHFYDQAKPTFKIDSDQWEIQFLKTMQTLDKTLENRLNEPYKAIYLNAHHAAQQLDVTVENARQYTTDWCPPDSIYRTNQQSTLQATCGRFFKNIDTPPVYQDEKWSMQLQLPTTDLSKAVENNHYSKIVTLSGSNRQDEYMEAYNTNSHKLSSFQALPNMMRDTFSHSSMHQHDTTLLQDMWRGFPPGTTMQQALPIWTPSVCANMPKQIDTALAKGEDQSKILLLYFQMKRAAQQNPHQKIDFMFNDDRDDILNGLKQFFTNHPDWMSPNVTLILQKMAGVQPIAEVARITHQANQTNQKTLTQEGLNWKQGIDEWFNSPSYTMKELSTQHLVETTLKRLPCAAQDSQSQEWQDTIMQEKQWQDGLIKIVDCFPPNQRRAACDAIVLTCVQSHCFDASNVLTFAKNFCYVANQKADVYNNHMLMNTPEKKAPYEAWLSNNDGNVVLKALSAINPKHVSTHPFSATTAIAHYKTLLNPDIACTGIDSVYNKTIKEIIFKDIDCLPFQDGIAILKQIEKWPVMGVTDDVIQRYSKTFCISNGIEAKDVGACLKAQVYQIITQHLHKINAFEQAVEMLKNEQHNFFKLHSIIECQQILLDALKDEQCQAAVRTLPKDCFTDPDPNNRGRILTHLKKALQPSFTDILATVQAIEKEATSPTVARSFNPLQKLTTAAKQCGSMLKSAASGIKIRLSHKPPETDAISTRNTQIH